MSVHCLLCYCKAITRAIIEDIKSKIVTINALRTIYSPLIKLLLFYITRESTIVKVKPMKVNMKLVNRAASVMLARALYKLIKFRKLEYAKTVQHSKLCLRLDEELECFDLASLGNDLKEVLSLYSTILLIIYTNILFVDKETLLIKTGDGIYWHIRRRSLDDISAPLLPFISEPYEYHEWFEKIVKENAFFCRCRRLSRWLCY